MAEEGAKGGWGGRREGRMDVEGKWERNRPSGECVKK